MGNTPRKKVSWSRKYRRWKRRMMKKHAWARTALPLMEGMLGFVIVLSIAGGALLALWPRHPAPADSQPTVARQVMAAAPSPTQTAAVTLEITPEPTPSPTPAPRLIDGIPEPLYHQTASPGQDYADPASNGLIRSVKVYADGKSVSQYAATDPIHQGASSEYSALEGVTTFRGTHYRDGGAYGTIPENPSKLEILWEKKIGHLDKWTGVGWTGQPGIVCWPEDLRQRMNITADKRTKDGLKEVLYATLDGHIYFLDLDDGQETRDPIDIGAPIKGSLTVDPRGLPLLYCGQGIYDVGGRRVKCGTRIWSLLDQSLLYMIDGADDLANRAWRAFDCAPLIAGDSDTMITAGENGVLYSVKLNAEDDGSAVRIDPEITRYVYKQSSNGKIGSENSVALYNEYVYFGNNSGYIQCVNLNTMELVWSFDCQDDIDASLAIEVEESGLVALYGANELDLRGSRGTSQMFKLNALTGELIWVVNSDPIYQNDENGGGSFATPAIGKGTLGSLVFFHVARTEDSKGMVYALNKSTGEIAWSYAMGSYGWSSPTCLYTPSGTGYVLVGSSNGILRLFEGTTGHVAAAAELNANIEGSPAVFNDTLVVGTRGSKIYALRIGG